MYIVSSFICVICIQIRLMNQFYINRHSSAKVAMHGRPQEGERAKDATPWIIPWKFRGGSFFPLMRGLFLYLVGLFSPNRGLILYVGPFFLDWGLYPLCGFFFSPREEPVFTLWRTIFWLAPYKTFCRCPWFPDYDDIPSCFAMLWSSLWTWLDYFPGILCLQDDRL